MAKVYSAPSEITPPDFVEYLRSGREDTNKSLEDYRKAEQEYIEALRKKAREGSEHALVGELLQFPIADGYAQYMVWRIEPLSLIHLPLMDAWEIPAAHVRGLNLSDVRRHVKMRKSLERILK